MRKKKSILFIRPDYHCSFFYRDEFRRQGWSADIYVNQDYPRELLYSDSDVLQAPYLKNIRWQKAKILINHMLLILWWLIKFWQYEYHFYYGRPPIVTYLEESIGFTKLFGRDFVFELFLSKLFKIKLLYLPSGCLEEETKENFEKLDSGNVCSNCGYFDRCDDKNNILNFERIRRYFDTTISTGWFKSSQYHTSCIKYKSIDLNIWSPDLYIPNEHRMPRTKNLRILHSAYLEKSGRTNLGKNIKGSPYVLAAINKLRAEGYPIEYYFITDMPSNKMRYYQIQADIVVEQLIYGAWGSTGVEVMALGKATVCYIRPSWKESFLRAFPEYEDLPIIEADTSNIYDILKILVSNDMYRHEKGEEARRFAEAHFDVVKNTKNLINLLNKL